GQKSGLTSQCSISAPGCKDHDSGCSNFHNQELVPLTLTFVLAPLPWLVPVIVVSVDPLDHPGLWYLLNARFHLSVPPHLSLWKLLPALMRLLPGLRSPWHHCDREKQTRRDLYRYLPVVRVEQY